MNHEDIPMKDMTLYDYFAATAMRATMQGLLNATIIDLKEWRKNNKDAKENAPLAIEMETIDQFAQLAWVMAHYMLHHRAPYRCEGEEEDAL